MGDAEIKIFIREALKRGWTKTQIGRSLVEAGWPISQVEIAFRGLKNEVSQEFMEVMVIEKTNRKPNRILVFGYAVLIGLVALLSGTVFVLWEDRLDLANTNSVKVRQFYINLARSQISFTDTNKIVFPDEKKFLDKKAQYIEKKESFIEVDLHTMRLSLYENGAQIRQMVVQAKGKDGSWWETPTGNYKVLGKEINHFSTIGKVWMPYSVQFYGNYFLHGRPHYDDGTLTPYTYSGGCIRLSNEDAKIVYDFAKRNMPVLVHEENELKIFGLLSAKPKSAPLPAITAKAFLITDLSSGDVILEKNADLTLPIASLTKLMTAVVAHELIYLGRPIKVTSASLASVSQIFKTTVGKSYRGFDLLYPLLMQSSNEAAKMLASYLGEGTFVKSMNEKSFSLGMKNTHFADASGISAENISTARDLSLLLQYINYKRRFLYDISKGLVFENVGIVKVGDTINIQSLANFNEFANEPDLIGMKNGETRLARQTIASVWNLKAEDTAVPVAIILLSSEDRVKDSEKLLYWLKSNYEAF